MPVLGLLVALLLGVGVAEGYEYYRNTMDRAGTQLVQRVEDSQPAALQPYDWPRPQVRSVPGTVDTRPVVVPAIPARPRAIGTVEVPRLPTPAVPAPSPIIGSGHFTLAEFARPAKNGFPVQAEYPREWVGSRLPYLLQSLETIREAAGGRAVRIVSGYRDPAYNRHVHGAADSQHVHGRAVDITVDGMSPAQVRQLVLDLMRAGQLPWVRGVGTYWSHVHIDVRPSDHVAMWGESGRRG